MLNLNELKGNIVHIHLALACESVFLQLPHKYPLDLGTGSAFFPQLVHEKKNHPLPTKTIDIVATVIQ